MSSKNKMLKKDQVMTRGAGYRRAVLCFESGLVYQYDNPENIVAVYDSGRWIMPKKPSYSTGGWGSGSSGDVDGGILWENASSLLSSIKAKVETLNVGVFMTQDSYKDYVRTLNKVRLIQNKAKSMGVSHSFNTDFKELKLTGDKYWNSKNGTGKGMDIFKLLKTYETALQVFKTGKGKEVKIESYTIGKNRVSQDKTIVAFRDSKNQVFMNSQVLSLTSFEQSFMGSQSLVQKELRELATYSIPFNVLESAELKLNETTVIERGPESTHKIKTHLNSSERIERHFTGALLLENSGRKFFMDIDREEIKHEIFNVFFVEVDSKVKSILEAYESMKPESVRNAEKSGTQVLRQGEWFFLDTGKTVELPADEVYTWKTKEMGEKHIERFDVSHGKGRPNSLYKPIGFGPEFDSLVCGLVNHSGREHRELNLGIKVKDQDQSSFPRGTGDEGSPIMITVKLWELVPNTTVGNFTITGDVD